MSFGGIGLDPYEGWWVMAGNIGPCIQGKVVTVYREAAGRRTAIARTQADCELRGPGDTQWQVLFGFGRSGPQSFVAGTDADTRVGAGLSNRVRYTVPAGDRGPEGSYVYTSTGFGGPVGPDYIGP